MSRPFPTALALSLLWLAFALASAPLLAQQVPPVNSATLGNLAGSAETAGEAGDAEREAAEDDEEDEIETDRDSFTPAVSVTPTGMFIVESAYSFIDNDRVADTHSVPELLVRYGMNDWLELRLGWNYEVGGAANPISGNTPGDFDEETGIETESRMLYGLKAWLTRQDAWMPRSVAIVQGFTPTSGKLTDTEMSASYVCGWELANRWVWDSGVRFSTDGQEGDDFNTWAASSVLKMPIGERWKVHAEYFGIYTDGRSRETVQHYFSPGAHYLINPNLEVGVRVGWGLNDQAANFFSNAGFGWRF